jgi:undecaprenyl-diphosphatase
VVGLVLTRFVLEPASFDSLKAALLGWAAGAATLVVLGAPSRRPTADAIRAGLADVGLPLETLAPASVDARGSTPYFGTDCDGKRYFVKALGTDQRSADLLFRLYRTAQRRDLGDERPFSSLRRAVEHEALVALAAHDLDIPTPRMRALAVADPNAFVLAYEAVDGRSLDGVPPEEMTDDVLADAWTQLARLRAVRIAHRDLRLANLFLASDGRIWMIDFGFSELAASDLLLANDVAELVASSAAVVGAARATSHARATVDATTLAAARERLHPWSLSGATRTALKQQPALLDDLRSGLATT